MNPDMEERIRSLAHRYWEEEGQPQGKEQEHWQRAREALQGQDGAPPDNEALRIPDRQQQAGGRKDRAGGGSVRRDEFGGDPDGSQSGQTKEQAFLKGATRLTPD